MGYNSKNRRAVAKMFERIGNPNISGAKYLVKVTWIGEIMGRKRPPTLKELSFKFRH